MATDPTAIATINDPKPTLLPGATATPTPTINQFAGTLNGADTQSDFNYNETLNNLFRDDSQLDADSKLQASRVKSDSTKALQQSKDNYAKALLQSKEGFASNGIVRSGNFLKDQGDISTNYAKDADQTISNTQRNLEDLARDTVSRKQAILLQKQQAEKAQADAKAQADLQRALIESQNRAYAEFKDALLGMQKQMNAPAAVAAPAQIQAPASFEDQGQALQDVADNGSVGDYAAQFAANLLAQNKQNAAPSAGAGEVDGWWYDANNRRYQRWNSGTGMYDYK